VAAQVARRKKASLSLDKLLGLATAGLPICLTALDPQAAPGTTPDLT
jgi:hypothetical protein